MSLNHETVDASTVAVATSRLTTSVMLVNAETAERWLESNTGNRPISIVTVQRYQSDMQSGRWAFVADPIRFSASGRLLDGQHRLSALAQAPGQSFPFLIVRGLPDEAQRFMDQGRKRTAGQQLAIDGIKNYSNVASGAKFYIIWRSGLMFRDNKKSQLISSPQIQEWVTGHADLVAKVSDLAATLRRNDAPPMISWAAAFRFMQIDEEYADWFFRTLAEGGAALGHPINTLDKRLQRIRREGLKISDRDMLSLFILAWNAAREDRVMVKFQRPRGGSWSAQNFPEPR